MLHLNFEQIFAEFFSTVIKKTNTVGQLLKKLNKFGMKDQTLDKF